MFKKLSALFLALPLVSALLLNPPTGQVNSSSSLTVTWTPASGQEVPAFDLYLANSNLHNTVVLANNVTTSSLSITVVLPSVQQSDGYSFLASSVGNAGNVLSQTTTFNITNPVSSSSLSGSSTSGISGSSTSLSTGISSTIPRSSVGTSTRTSDTNSPTVAFNGNGALGVTGIGATVVGLLVAAGTFWAL